MTMLDRVERGAAFNLPPRSLLFGAPGIGKTTTLARDGCLFAQTEDGLGLLDVPAVTISTYDEMLQLMREVAYGESDCKHLVLDSADGFESITNAAVCEEGGKTSIEAFGYGKGYTYSAEKWAWLLHAGDYLRRKGIAVTLISHATATHIADPTLGDYVRWSPNLSKKVLPLVEKWADIIGYMAHERAITERGDRDSNRTVRTSQTTGSRFIHVEDNGSFIAKNRYSLPPTIEITLSGGWNDVESAIEQARAKSREGTSK